jgi:DNA-binding NtrC family response regulator
VTCPRATILVIDDDDGLRALLDEMLTDEGYATHLLASTTPARTAIDLYTPDLIVLDVWLVQPNSGWQFLDALRRDRATGRIPVVVLSSNAWLMADLIVHFPEPHYAFVKKPFDLEELLDPIRRLLAQRS